MAIKQRVRETRFADRVFTSADGDTIRQWAESRDPTISAAGRAAVETGCKVLRRRLSREEAARDGAAR